MAFQFNGFSAPNGTFVPDEVFDILAPELSEAELRVLLYIIRRTFGFKKNSDNISLKQMTEGITTREGRVLDRGTGLSKAGNAKGIRGLVDKGVVVSTRNRSVQKGDQATTYTLRFKEAAQVGGIGGARSTSEDQTPVSTKETGGCPPSRQGRVHQVDTQETVLQQTVLQETDFNPSNIREPQAEKTPNCQTSRQRNEVPTLASSQQTTFEPIGSVLLRVKPQQLHSSETAEEARDAIRAYLQDIALKFNDQAPLESSVSRAYNLYKAVHLPVGEFLSRLLGTSSTVRERRSKVKKQVNGAKLTMPYFFACLEGELGLRPKKVDNGADLKHLTGRYQLRQNVQEESAQFSPASASSLAREQGGKYLPPHTHSFAHGWPHGQSGQSSVDARSTSTALP